MGTREFAPYPQLWGTREFAPYPQLWGTREFAPYPQLWGTREFAPYPQLWGTREFAPYPQLWGTRELKVESTSKELPPTPNYGLINTKNCRLGGGTEPNVSNTLLGSVRL